MLNDEVVQEVDALAHQLGTNRSALINRILAEYVGFTTPERRINDVLSAMERLRAACDQMETIVSTKAWPLPTYNKILFYC